MHSTLHQTTALRPVSVVMSALMILALTAVADDPPLPANILEPVDLFLTPESPSDQYPPEGHEPYRIHPRGTQEVRVTVDKTGVVGGANYQLSGDLEVEARVDDMPNDILWSVSGPTDAGDKIVQTLTITNTAPDIATATATISCAWVRQGSGGGGGSASLAGIASYEARLEGSVVDWQFEREIAIYNLAEHTEEDRHINFTVFFYDTACRILTANQISGIEVTAVADPEQGGGGSGLISQITEALSYVTNWVHGQFDAEDPEEGGAGFPVVGFDDGASQETDTNVGLAVAPAQVIEFAPLMRDEALNDIEGSEEPQPDQLSNPLVKRQPADPHNAHPVADDPRIAWREVRIRVGNGAAMEGEVVTWSLEPTYVHPNAQEPDFRGTFAASANHSDHFEEATEFDPHDFQEEQEQVTTTIDAEGYTAIRVNLPPHGLNSARIMIEMDHLDQPLAITEVFVPIVVVIDPGHGDDDGGAGYSHTWNQDGNPVTVTVNEREVVMVLSDRLIEELQARRALEGSPFRFGRFYLTRSDNNQKPPFATRARTAGNLAADVFLSIHTNAFNKQVRGIESFYQVQATGNNHVAADTELAKRISAATFTVLQNSNLRGQDGARPETQSQHPRLWVLDDQLYNNTATYGMVRGVLHEVEFLDNLAAFQEVWGTGENDGAAIATRQHLAQEWADAILLDIQMQPAPLQPAP